MLIPAALVGVFVFLYGLFTMDSSQVRSVSNHAADAPREGAADRPGSFSPQ